jgi:KDO2-lipid IV(A) lauroyltransferase
MLTGCVAHSKGARRFSGISLGYAPRLAPQVVVNSAKRPLYKQAGAIHGPLLFDLSPINVLTVLFKLIAAMPLAVVQAIGGTLGRAVYWLSPTYRRRLIANLRNAGYLEADLLRSAVREAGKQGLETPWVWLRQGSDVLACTAVEGLDTFEAALAEDRPLIVLAPHLGCFEMIPRHYVAARPAPRARPLTLLYRIPRKAILRPLVESGRAGEGVHLAPADLRGVRMMIKAMRQREMVGILPDQVPSQGEGVWAPFFGRWAYTMTLPARLALQFNAVVLFAFAERLARGSGYRVHFSRMTERFSGDPARDAALLNSYLELLVRRLPAQYLWGYNRYKTPAGAEPPPLQAPP